VLTALSLSMFGLYELRVPAGLSNVAGTAKGGILGAFFMGLTVGIVAAPCIGPFVFGLLTFVGEKGNPALGFLLFFTLALGLGLPFLVLAVASGSISRLPRSGEWMEWVRKIFGVILLAMALYFLRPLMPDRIYHLLLAALLAASALALGFLIRIEGGSRLFLAARRLVGAGGLLAALYLALVPWATKPQVEGIRWVPYREELLREAASEGRPVMIDFFAEWCIPCKELDIKTFSHPQVVAASQGILALKADLTKSASAQVAKLRKQYGIKGVPTVVFLGPDGKERKDLRVLGFVDKEEFLERLRKFKDSTR